MLILRPLSAVLVGAALISSAMAQPGLPPASAAVAGIHAEVKADVAQVKTNAKTSAITREQIQQLRTALKAKLTALRK